MAHPVRFQILQFLAETKTCKSGDIYRELSLRRKTANQHLNELKEIGLIDNHNESVKTYYYLNINKVKGITLFLKQYLYKPDVVNYKCE